jgi:hypothetical protein
MWTSDLMLDCTRSEWARGIPALNPKADSSLIHTNARIRMTSSTDKGGTRTPSRPIAPT